MDKEKEIEIRERLKIIADTRFNSIADFSRQLGYSKSTVLNYINGKFKLNDKFLSRVKNGGVNELFLYHGIGFPLRRDYADDTIEYLDLEKLYETISNDNQYKLNYVIYENFINDIHLKEEVIFSLIQYLDNILPFAQVLEISNYVGSFALVLKKLNEINSYKVLKLTIEVPKINSEEYIKAIKLACLYEIRYHEIKYEFRKSLFDNKEKINYQKHAEFRDYTTKLLKDSSQPISKLIDKEYFTESELKIVEQLIDFKIQD